MVGDAERTTGAEVTPDARAIHLRSGLAVAVAPPHRTEPRQAGTKEEQRRGLGDWREAAAVVQIGLNVHRQINRPHYRDGQRTLEGDLRESGFVNEARTGQGRLASDSNATCKPTGTGGRPGRPGIVKPATSRGH